MTTRLHLIAALTTMGALTSTAALADGAADQKATAQILFEQGRAAVTNGNFADACPKFAESQRIDPGLGTQLWLADCYENNGQTATAWGTFKEAASVARLRSDPREQVAQDRATALESKLSRLTIVVPSSAHIVGLDVRRDGVLVAPLVWGAAVPVDPGMHAISVNAPGKKEWSTVVTVAAGPTTMHVTVPVLDVAAAPAAMKIVHVQAPPAVGQTQRWVGIGVGALGLVSLGVGSYFSLNAKSIYDATTREGHCISNVCDKEGMQDRQGAFDQATAATIALVAGAVAIAGGIVLVITAPRALSMSISPSVHGASFAATIRF